MTRWWKEDNGNQPRRLGKASETLLRTIAQHDTGKGVHFKWESGGFFRLIGAAYRVKRTTFHPLYDEYQGDNPTNRPLLDETPADVGMFVFITEAGRAWLKLRDKGEIPGLSSPAPRIIARPPSPEVFLASALEDAESTLRQLTRLTDRLADSGHASTRTLANARDAHWSMSRLVKHLKDDLRQECASKES